MKKQVIIGYLVLDNGEPVRHYEDQFTGESHYFATPTAKHAVSIFRDVEVARRLKSFLQRKYKKMARHFDPPQQANDRERFELWQKRSASIRISGVRIDDATWSNSKRPPLRSILIFLALLVSGACAQAQTKVDFALYTADTTIRTLDITSTHKLMTDPCGCWREADPISPSGRSVPALLAFQYGLSTAFSLGGRELVIHHHPRLGRLLIAADIVSESIAVQHNMRQHLPTVAVAAPQGFVPFDPVPHSPIIARPR